MKPPRPVHRRDFLGAAAALAASTAAARRPAASLAAEPLAAQPLPVEAAPSPPDLPMVDLHAHLDNSTIERVVELSKERGIRLGIVEHAGTEENEYPVVLSSDEELLGYISMLEGKPVWKGVQTEWSDWTRCFSREALGRLDYILTDGMTFYGGDGKRFKAWEPGFEVGDPETFMDRFVDWYLRIIETQPIDIFANFSWLPAPLSKEHDRYWTEVRMRRVVDAAVKAGVAIEISSGFELPKAPFIRLAKEAGLKFSFGSNGRYPNMGKIDWSLRVARDLGLGASDIFLPAPPGKRAIDRFRTFRSA